MLDGLFNLTHNRATSTALALLSLTAALVAGTGKQALANPMPNAASSLLPLEDGKISAYRSETGLSEAAESINIAFADDRDPEVKSDEFDLAGVPIVGELLDENGKFDWGMDLPVSFDFGNLLGNTVLIVGTDFTTD